jgi:hypothetical protein
VSIRFQADADLKQAIVTGVLRHVLQSIFNDQKACPLQVWMIAMFWNCVLNQGACWSVMT